MSKAEILEEISKLTPEEREEIRLKLDELDAGVAIKAHYGASSLNQLYDQIEAADALRMRQISG